MRAILYLFCYIIKEYFSGVARFSSETTFELKFSFPVHYSFPLVYVIKQKRLDTLQICPLNQKNAVKNEKKYLISKPVIISLNYD